MKTKWPTFEVALGALVAVLGAIIITSMCQPAHIYAQSYGVPLKAEYNKWNVQDEFDRLWNFITELNICDVGSAIFDSVSYYDTVYTNIKFDTILYVGVTFDSSSIGAGYEENPAWVATLSDTSVIIMRHELGENPLGACNGYTWLVAGRLKKP